MKRLLITVLSMLVFLGTVSIAYSQTKSPLPSPADENIKDFKDKVASATAKFNKNNNKAVSGFITDIGSNRVTINTSDDQTYEVKLDDILTKYYRVAGAGKKEIKLSDIDKGNYAIVTGVINDKSVNANFIYLDESYIVKVGKVSEVNQDTYTLKVITTDKDNYNLDIETSTKQQIINSKTLAVEKVGFSKIKVGDTIHFAVKQTGQEKNNTYSALKILILPQEYFMQ